MPKTGLCLPLRWELTPRPEDGGSVPGDVSAAFLDNRIFCHPITLPSGRRGTNTLRETSTNERIDDAHAGVQEIGAISRGDRQTVDGRRRNDEAVLDRHGFPGCPKTRQQFRPFPARFCLPRSRRSTSNSCPGSTRSVRRNSAGRTIWPLEETVVFIQVRYRLTQCTVNDCTLRISAAAGSQSLIPSAVVQVATGPSMGAGKQLVRRRVRLVHRTGIFTSGPLIQATLRPRVAVPAAVPSGTRKSTR